VINAVNELLYNCVEGLSDALSKQTPHTLGFTLAPGEMRETDDDGNDLMTARENEELENGIHQLETLLEIGVDRNFDAFELFVLRNLLVVERTLVPWVRLPHHKVCQAAIVLLQCKVDRVLIGCRLCKSRRT
jgi:kinetochore protein Mis12/MTW1